MGLGGVGFPRNLGGGAGAGGHGPALVATGVLPVRGRRRDRFQGARWQPGCPAGACGDPGVIAVNGRRARPSGVDDGRVLPVTPYGPWRFVPGKQSGGGGDLAGWVLSLHARRSDSAFPAPSPGQPRPAGFEESEAAWPRGKTRRTAPGCRGTAVTARRWPRSSRRSSGVRGRDRRGEGVRDGVHPGAGESRAGGGRRYGGWKPPAGGVTALMDHLCARACSGSYWNPVRLLAHLALPGRGGRAGGVAGQRPRRQAPAGAGQERHGGLRSNRTTR